MAKSGVNGIKNGNDYCGVGFIIIPKGVDAELYKKDCFRTGRVCIYGGYGHSNFYDVLIDSEALQDIEFPSDNDIHGSPVLWVNIPNHNQPVVVASLKYDQNISGAAEFARKFTKTYKQNIVNFEMNAKEGRMNVSVNSNTGKAKFEILVNNKDNNSELIIKVAGQTIIHSSGRVVMISEDRIETVITDKRGQVVAKTKLINDGDDRYIYEDEFHNKMTFGSEKVNFRADDSSSIEFGDGAEKAVLGETLKTIFEEYDDAFKQMTVNTSFGPSSVRINEASFETVRNKFEDFLSKLVKLD